MTARAHHRPVRTPAPGDLRHNVAVDAWHLYVLRTRRGALYTGITTDVARRCAQHAAGRGAKALRARGPLTLVYSVAFASRGEALRAERALQRLSKPVKERLLAARPDRDGLRHALALERAIAPHADCAASDGVRTRRRRDTVTRPSTPDRGSIVNVNTDIGVNRFPSGAAPLDREACWRAVRARDRDADGRFVYAVRSTGVYCRPSCPSRPARPENVSFHPSPAAARAAGYRACKRCKPDHHAADGAHAGVIAACRAIEAAEELPDLTTLAAAAGLSRFHFHRLFKAVTGVTPKAYAAAWRSRRVREALQSGAPVTAALYAAGYNSNARFYHDAPAILGMTPSAYRAGGANEQIRFAIGECSLGAILVAATARGLCAILLGDDPDALARELQDRFPNATLCGDDENFAHTVALVVGFVEAPALGLELPLDIRGTAFQQRVWQALREIPPGVTMSYAEVAARIGRPRAVRAVAQACGANALAVAIPCHRVVRSDGALSGYRWGVQRKRALLEREARS